jgi:hypothetical protein
LDYFSRKPEVVAPVRAKNMKLSHRELKMMHYFVLQYLGMKEIRILHRDQD